MSDDLISRQAAIEAIRAEREWLDENIEDVQHHFHMMNETTRILSIIGNLPSVQPKTGQWVKYPDCNGCFKCSECGMLSLNRLRYCCGCGAKMEERWSK
jgi:hypothetical protein